MTGERLPPKDEPGRESRHDEVLRALERALKDNPRLRDKPTEEVSRELVLSGYLREDPPLAPVAEALATIIAEEQAFGPDVPLDEA
jgi:hypothetical protein